MKYYPLEDPVSHITVMRINKSYSDINVFVDGKLAGVLRVSNHRLDALIGNTFAGKNEIVEIENGLITWHGDYDKPVVISRAGEVVRVKTLETRDE